MKIAIDARDALRRQTGVGTYAINLIKGLAQIDKENQYLLYLDRYRHPEIGLSNLPNQNNFRLKTLSISGPLWKQALLPASLLINRANLFHSPTSTLQALRPCRSIVTFHDLFNEVNTEWTPEKLRTRLHRLYKFSATSADKIIAVSENTKKDLIKFYGIPEGKVVVVHNGRDEFYQPVQDEEGIVRIRQKYQTGERFILHVGGLALWRNIPRLLEALLVLKKKELPHKLVLVGRQFWGFDLAREVARLKLADKVVSIDYVSKEDLRLLYNAAEVLAFPSLYEGFGFPALEAMACGTPTVVSEAAALPEVVGEAAFLIDPYDVSSIASGIERVIEDEKLRLDLGKKGFERIALFSWEKTARETLKVYQGASERGD